MLSQNLLKKIREQKQKLIELDQKLKHFFVEIEIPKLGSVDFLPIRSFRDFCLFTGNPSPNNTTFLSSGSTNEKRARHIFSPNRLEIYADKSAENFLCFLNRHGFDQNTSIVSLIPPPDIWKDSSLARMISMLKNRGFQIQYVDAETHPESLSLKDNSIIFGTTFHHFLVATHYEPNVQRLAIIDTGGTKGRMITHSLTETQEILRSAYGNPKTFLFLSEYGMCELGSQAWSTQKIHDGTFSAANTLFPFSICLKTRRALPLQKKGFLGFIDLVNLEESYPAIITEDIGSVLDEENRVFRFYHRAPNASIKGCSLNVKENFKFVSKTPSPSLSAASRPDLCIRNTRVGVSLAAPRICSFEKNYFKVTNPNALKNKNILIIASANIPITWLYPTQMAAMMGANSVHIKLPSLRDNDPLSEVIQNQIQELVEKFRPDLAPTEIVIEKNRDLSDDFDYFDYLIVFGTNSTIQTFEKKLKGKKTKLIPQGEVRNSLDISLNDDPAKIAELCSLWLGRGCLTPVCLFMGSVDVLSDTWISDFSKSLEQNFLNLYAQYGTSIQFLHDHNILHTESLLKSFGMDVEKNIIKSDVTCVVNLTSLSQEHLPEIDFSFGGCGFVFILNSDHKKMLPKIIQTKITPDLNDPHGGKTWEEWLTP